MVDGIEIQNDYVVRVRLKRPTASIEAALAGAGGCMISPAALGNDDLTTRPVGTGPYQVDRFMSGDRVEYVPAPGEHWDSAAPAASRLVIKSMQLQAALNAFRAGELDLMPARLGYWQQLEPDVAAGRYEMHANTSVHAAYAMFLNKTRGPLADERVRHAIFRSIDHDALASMLFGASGAPARQFFREGFPGHDPAIDAKHPFDRQHARALLAEAGYSNGLVLDPVLTSPDVKDVAEAAQGMLAEVGIHAELRSAEVREAYSQYGQGEAAGLFGFCTLQIGQAQTVDRYVRGMFNVGGPRPRSMNSPSRPTTVGGPSRNAPVFTRDSTRC